MCTCTLNTRIGPIILLSGPPGPDTRIGPIILPIGPPRARALGYTGVGGADPPDGHPQRGPPRRGRRAGGEEERESRGCTWIKGSKKSMHAQCTHSAPGGATRALRIAHMRVSSPVDRALSGGLRGLVRAVSSADGVCSSYMHSARDAACTARATCTVLVVVEGHAGEPAALVVLLEREHVGWCTPYVVAVHHEYSW